MFVPWSQFKFKNFGFLFVAFSLNSWCIEDALGAFVYFHANSLGSCRNGASFLYIFFLASVHAHEAMEHFFFFFLAYSLGSWKSTFFSFLCANSLGSCSSGASFLLFQFKLVKEWSLVIFFMISFFSLWKHILGHLIHTEICAYKWYLLSNDV